MKDNFSSSSDQYARYRPAYPRELFDYLNALVSARGNAWDCGTGTGQVAYELAKTFDKVFATDISRSQLDNALKADNITYSLQPAERTDFKARQFDLIVVAQAIHWFDFEKFYAEVRRTAREGALICVTGYGRIKISEEIDPLISNFYKNVIGAYWDKERQYIDEHYETIPFPFDEIETPEFENRLRWSLDHLTGYLNTWSAVKHFVRRNGYNPVEELKAGIARHWGCERESDRPRDPSCERTKDVRFPLLLRVGRIRRPRPARNPRVARGRS